MRRLPTYGGAAGLRAHGCHTDGVATDVAGGWTDLLDGEEIAYSGHEPHREPTFEPLPDDLEPLVASALVASGVTALYRHQA